MVIVTQIMKLRLVSDLHTEHRPWNYQFQGEDVVLIAGDSVNGVADVCQDFHAVLATIPVPVVMTLGNHEFYCGNESVVKNSRRMVNTFSDLAHVHVLNAAAWTYNGITFCGCPLYTDFMAAGVEEAPYVKLAWRSMSDNRRCPSAGDEYLVLAQTQRQFIAETVATAVHPVVVMTHWVPSLRLTAAAYVHEPVQFNATYVCACDEIFNPAKIVLWHFGHSHKYQNRYIDGVHFIANPRGYPGENQRWRKNFIITV